MAVPRVFISHASADAAFANHLADDLRRQGADCWLDSSHLGAGDFVARINAALAGRDQVILVLTPAAIQSQWVNREVSAAIVRENQGLMRPMIVVMAQPCDPSAIPPLWTTYHRYNAASDFSGAARGVAAELGLTAPQVQQPVSAWAATLIPGQAPIAPAVPAPIKPAATFMGSSVKFSRLLVASLVALVLPAVFLTLPAVFLTGSAPQFIGGLPYEPDTAVWIGVISLIAQAVGFGILWTNIRATWSQKGRRVSHPWVVGALAAAEILAFTSLLFEGKEQFSNAGQTALLTAGVFLVTLVASVALAWRMRQWRWIAALLIPIPIGLLIFLETLVTWGTQGNSPIVNIGGELATLGIPTAWLFVALVFALAGPARKA